MHPRGYVIVITIIRRYSASPAGERDPDMPEYALKPRSIPLIDTYDVIVAGGGPAGCAAATAAAREGARTLLLESDSALGGMGTLGLVPWFCGYHDREKIIARGLAMHVHDRLRENMPHFAEWLAKNPLHDPPIDPELLKRIYDDMVTGAGADVLFMSRMTAVEKSADDEVEALIVASKAGLRAYRAKVYVDCTGDGDLAAWAGAPFEKGMEDGAMQPGTHCFVIANIDEEALAKGPRIHFYDPASPIHEAIRSPRYPDIIDPHTCNMKIGPGVFGFNTGHVYGVDNTSPESISKALLHGRKMTAQYRQAFADLHPAFRNAFLAATGSQMGIRETRRIIGDYKITVDDYLARRSFPDEICRNAYGIDVHGQKNRIGALTNAGIDAFKKANEELTRPYEKGESFGVPYRCLTPKGLKNVLVGGRCISADRQANGSIRIMACCLNTGEAAGIGAAMAAKDTRDVHGVNTDELRAKLRAFGAYLPTA